MVKTTKSQTATGQNGDTEMATEMAIFKTVTNPINTYSSSEAYIAERRLYTRYGTVKSYKNVNIHGK